MFRPKFLRDSFKKIPHQIIPLYNPLALSSINFLKLAGVLEGFPSNVEHNPPKKNLRKSYFSTHTYAPSLLVS